MAAKAEVLTSSARSSNRIQKHRRTGERIAAGFAAWVRRGQLGSSNTTEMARYMGARV